MMFMRFVPALLLLAVVFIGIKLLYGFRASAMRALALKWGFQYSRGEPRMLYLPKNHSPQPASFRLPGFPVDTMNRTWNLIEGEKNGLKIPILDSTLSMGGRNGRCSTFIAVRIKVQAEIMKRQTGHPNVLLSLPCSLLRLSLAEA